MCLPRVEKACVGMGMRTLNGVTECQMIMTSDTISFALEVEM